MTQNHNAGSIWHEKEANVVSINICIANLFNIIEALVVVICPVLSREYELPRGFLAKEAQSDHLV